MDLKKLIAQMECTVEGGLAAEVTGISYDSRAVRSGDLFAAIPGEHTDGHGFIKSAVERGASCVLCERPQKDVAVPQVVVRDIRAALSKASDVFYGRPSERMALIGITGTNGKTTTSYLLESILKAAGKDPGVIGTVNYRYGATTFEAPHTTPQAPDLHRILSEMADGGVTHCVMEVSSHALEQKRVRDCRFAAGVFTNLTHDHLDYHKTMEEYYRCKAILFSYLDRAGKPFAVNIDDQWGRRLKKDFPQALTYSLKPGADVYPEESSLKPGRTEAVIKTPGWRASVESHLAGEYNLQNILAAVALSYAVGLSPDAVSKGIASLERVPGRLEKIEAPGGFQVYVDYAHTGDALERALGALKAIAEGRIITVFGCGGNRDRTKRPKMGEVAARLSDVTIVTSDNPRDEDPLEIIKEIEAGIKGVAKFAPGSIDPKGYTVVPDRAEALNAAVGMAKRGDTILVAGKGHEDYQIIKGKKSHFSDFEEISKSLEARAAKKVS